MSTLRIVHGSQKGKRFDIARGILTLGRDQTNSVQIPDYEVSRRHAEIRTRGAHFLISDLGSSNGTFVNGNRISTRRLKSGDQIQIGQTVFLFKCDSETETSNRTDSEETVDVALGSFGSTIFSAGADDSDVSLPLEMANWVARAKSNIQVMYETALATSHHQDIEGLVDRILHLVFNWVAADRACVLLNRVGGNVFETSIYRSVVEDDVIREEFDVDQSLIEFVLEKQEGVLSNDFNSDTRFVDSPSDQENRTEIICVPIRGIAGVIGLIYADRTQRPGDTDDQTFDEEQLKLLIAIGHQSAIAIKNVDYYATLLASERATAVGHVMKTLSHHIKNILQSINGGTHLIEDGLRNQQYELVQSGWQIVQRNQENMSNLVMDMLSFSKRQAPTLQTYSLGKLLSKTVAALKRRAEYFGVQLQLEIEDALPNGRFDSELLQRAVFNIISAAMNSCRDNSGGTVRIRARFDWSLNLFFILVEDNGLDLSEEELNSLFDPLDFNQYTNRIGLGMAVSKNIVTEHGGTIEVVSNSGTGGTLCRIALPRGEQLENDTASDISPVIPVSLEDTN